MTLYFEICKHQTQDFPYAKENIQRLLEFNLTHDEIEIVQLRISEYTYIYLIRDDDSGATKIGRSDEPETRLKQLKRQDTLLPTENNFRILHVWASLPYMERVLHQCYADKRVRGEWFNLTEEDINEIATRYF